MSSEQSPADYWRWPALLLWLMFFLLGLWPEITFDLFRAAGRVFSQNAIVNSYNFITWSLTGYVGYFVYHRAIEAGLPPLEALGKAIQLGILAFVAFIDLPIEQIPEIRNAGDRALVMGTIGLKLLVWLYLYVLMARYHWKREPRIIAGALPYLALTMSPAREPGDGKAPKTASEAEERSSVENPVD